MSCEQIVPHVFAQPRAHPNTYGQSAVNRLAA